MISDEERITNETRPLVLITGASRGIGAQTALRFAEGGWDLALCCKEREDDLRKVADSCESYTGSEVFTFAGDLSDPDIVNELCARLSGKDMLPDVVIHIAGITRTALLQDLSFYDWTDILDTNITALFGICKNLLPGMIRRQSGKILAASSVYGNVGGACEVAYSTSKGAVNGFVRALSKELAPSHIQVNAVAPGAVDTDMLEESGLDAEGFMALVNDIPAGRIGRPREIAEVFWDLANAPEYLTGQIIAVDGGWT